MRHQEELGVEASAGSSGTFGGVKKQFWRECRQRFCVARIEACLHHYRHAMYSGSVLRHAISENSRNLCAKCMIVQFAEMKAIQVRLREPSVLSNEACK